MDEISLQIALLSEKIQNLSNKFEGAQNSILAWSPSIVGFFAAFVALIVGLMSTKNAKRQIEIQTDIGLKTLEGASNRERDNFISNSRREWIENLRKALATFFALSDQAHRALHLDNMKKACDKSDEMEYHQRYIQLMLNPKEEEHNSFIQKMDEMMLKLYSARKKEEGSFEAYVAIKNEVLQSSKTILKAEWDKAKNRI